MARRNRCTQVYRALVEVAGRLFQALLRRVPMAAFTEQAAEVAQQAQTAPSPAQEETVPTESLLLSRTFKRLARRHQCTHRKGLEQ